MRPASAPRTVRAFGLRLCSDVPFPELAAADGPPDVRLELASLAPVRPAEVTGESWFSATRDEAWFLWPDFAAVRVSRGRLVQVDPVPAVDPDQLRAALLGPVFSVLLLQRGLLPLHASALALHGRAAAFLAGSGSGKSTLAAALRGRGHAFLSDDVTAVRLDGERPWMVASYPCQKLTPTSVDRLPHTVRDEHAPLVNPDEDKHLYALDQTLPDDLVELAAVYVLEDADELSFERVRGAEALFLLLRHCHRSPLLHRAVGSAEMMRRCAWLTERVAAFRLRRPFDLERLDELAAAVEEHMLDEKVA